MVTQDGVEKMGQVLRVGQLSTRKVVWQEEKGKEEEGLGLRAGAPV